MVPGARGWQWLPWLWPSAAVEQHSRCLRGSLLVQVSVLPSFHCPGEGALLGAGHFPLAAVQPVDRGVGCQEGPMVHGHGSAGLLQQLPLSAMDPTSLWSTRGSSLACPGHAEHGNVPVLPLLESPWLQPACPAHHAVHMASALSSPFQPIQCLPLEAAGWRW